MFASVSRRAMRRHTWLGFLEAAIAIQSSFGPKSFTTTAILHRTPRFLLFFPPKNHAPENEYERASERNEDARKCEKIREREQTLRERKLGLERGKREKKTKRRGFDSRQRERESVNEEAELKIRFKCG